MPKPLSEDLRERVIEAIEGGASRRAAAERFEVSASSAVKWMQRWRQTGSAAAKLSGGLKNPFLKELGRGPGPGWGPPDPALGAGGGGGGGGANRRHPTRRWGVFCS